MLTVPSDCFCSLPWICAVRSMTISHTRCWTLQQSTNDVGPDRQVKCSSSQPAWIKQSGQVDQGLSQLTRNCKTYVCQYFEMFPEIFMELRFLCAPCVLCVLCVFHGWKTHSCAAASSAFHNKQTTDKAERDCKWGTQHASSTLRSTCYFCKTVYQPSSQGGSRTQHLYHK